MCVSYPAFHTIQTQNVLFRFVLKRFLPNETVSVCFVKTLALIGSFTHSIFRVQRKTTLLDIPRRTIQVLTIKYITNVFIEWHRNVKTVWLTCFHTFIDSYDTVIVTKFMWQSVSRGKVRHFDLFNLCKWVVAHPQFNHIALSATTENVF